MHFRIEHTTEYLFRPAVFLEPHQLRFQPRSDGAQLLRHFELTIEPRPSVLSHTLDPEGNVVAWAWFREMHERLVIRAVAEVETVRDNPFDYLLTPKHSRLPITYPPREAAALVLAHTRQRRSDGTDAVLALAERICRARQGELVPFLGSLNQAIYQQLEVIHREEGDPWAPAATLEMRRGACRDLAVLYVDACRAMGLAARFVSGYQEGDAEQDCRELHAWAEVFVPGAGWRGYDPTHGLAVADGHVAAAASTDPLLTAPVTGTFRGSAESEFRTDVQIQVTSGEAVAV